MGIFCEWRGGETKWFVQSGEGTFKVCHEAMDIVISLRT